MPMFTKRPVTIEARQFIFNDFCVNDLIEWMGKSFVRIVSENIDDDGKLHDVELEIRTLEDGHDNRIVHIATEYDWIIKGVDGEFYACKPDIFHKTYMTEQSKQAIFVWSDDWEGLYLDGKLVAQGHEVSGTHVARSLGYKLTSVEADREWITYEGELPELFENVELRDD